MNDILSRHKLVIVGVLTALCWIVFAGCILVAIGSAQASPQLPVFTIPILELSFDAFQAVFYPALIGGIAGGFYLKVHLELRDPSLKEG